DINEIFYRYPVDQTDQIDQTDQTDQTDHKNSIDQRVLIPEEEYHYKSIPTKEVASIKEQIRQLQSELNDLGEINWTAIEEYERQQKRHVFIKEQEEELLKSLTDLQNAINYIDEKSKLKFKEAFQEINQRFQKVFPILFGGGNANIELLGTIEDPEAGVEIIACPPGKKMQ
ncbi:MAG: hypothetical protein HQK53_09960, partial [Oligoflexia bacterium]|nr:hypothetical protein [Oligoflexia bacterium]